MKFSIPALFQAIGLAITRRDSKRRDEQKVADQMTAALAPLFQQRTHSQNNMRRKLKRALGARQVRKIERRARLANRTGA